MLGAGLLWFGWFGFNGGSAGSAGPVAVLAFVNTLLAPGAALLMWMLLDRWRHGRPTAVGAATGAVVGLVAVTPAAGYIAPAHALVLGALAALPSHFVMMWRPRAALDDSLDVFAAHGRRHHRRAARRLRPAAWHARRRTGDRRRMEPRRRPSRHRRRVPLSLVNVVLLKLIGLAFGLRPSEREEGIGMDVVQHGEEAYNRGEGAVLVLGARAPRGESHP
jgi:Amt family ammonium transporter